MRRRHVNFKFYQQIWSALRIQYKNMPARRQYIWRILFAAKTGNIMNRQKDILSVLLSASRDNVYL